MVPPPTRRIIQRNGQYYTTKPTRAGRKKPRNACNKKSLSCQPTNRPKTVNTKGTTEKKEAKWRSSTIIPHAVPGTAHTLLRNTPMNNTQSHKILQKKSRIFARFSILELCPSKPHVMVTSKKTNIGPARIRSLDVQAIFFKYIKRFSEHEKKGAETCLNYSITNGKLFSTCFSGNRSSI